MYVPAGSVAALVNVVRESVYGLVVIIHAVVCSVSPVLFELERCVSCT